MLDSQRHSSAREIPETLHNSLTARLDRLGPARDVAQIGAVIGREFSYELLRAVSSLPEAALQSSLTLLANADLIYARGRPPEAKYLFKHSLIQDAAYDALLKSKRRELHARVAQTIEKEMPALAEAQPQILARHWTDAGETEPAIAAWTKAAAAADAHSAFKEAEEAYRQARDLLLTLPGTPERDAREIDLLFLLTAVVSNNYGWTSNEVADVSARTASVIEKSGNLLQLLVSRFGATVAAWQAGDFTKAKALADQVLDLAQREGGDFGLRCAHEAQIWTCHHVADFAGAGRHYEAWLQICERSGYGTFPAETPAAAATAAHAAWHVGRAAMCDERIALAEAFGRQSTNPIDLVVALTAKSQLLAMGRHPEATQEVAAEAVAIAEEHNLPVSYAEPPRFYLLWARAQLGHYQENVPRMRASIAAMFSDGGRRAATEAILPLANVHNTQGALADALATIERFLADRGDCIDLLPTAFHLRGDVRMKLEQKEQAEADFLKAIELARNIGSKPLELRAATSLARLWAGEGKRNEAQELLAPIYAWFTDGFDARDLVEAKAQLEALRG